jgi:lipopolysaccharide transport system ATP-binding protein
MGRNGSGKSTLLKLISRITAPTTGTIKIHGRVASLLEVGTGFNPELTGKENVYLNGSIMGLKEREINHRYSRICEFAEIADFMNTPVKRYSSGMRVRLAFAVAAHLEPEIMILDEVLAVGDAKFQDKCLNRINEIKNSINC